MKSSIQCLNINNLSFKYKDRYIFRNVNLSINNNWTAIIGSNGSGKTTLLKLISKKESPENGNIKGNELVYYCPQSLEQIPQGYDEFIYTYTNKTFKLKNLLKIEDEWLYRWETLSYGERKRIQIAIALYFDPDILLLDEPTNHLDTKVKNIIIKTLKKFNKIGILVSHDREILDTLCVNTILIEHNTVYKYKANYSTSMKEHNTHLEFLKKRNENIDKNLKKLEKNVQIQKEKISLSKTKLSKKGVNKKDSSLKEKINLAKLTGKDKNDSRQMANIKKKEEQLSYKKINLVKKFDEGIKIEEKLSKKTSFSFVLKGGSLRLCEDKTLLYPNININKNDKISIFGHNGVGKSSFLKYLVSKILIKEHLLYLPQELLYENKIDLLHYLKNLDNEKKGKMFTLIRRLNCDPETILDNKNLSEGEIRKLFIAKALLEEINLIILDEPTNHMDINSIISLEKALKNYKKALIIVSHDNIFSKNISNKFWNISNVCKNRYKVTI